MCKLYLIIKVKLKFDSPLPNHSSNTPHPPLPTQTLHFLVLDVNWLKDPCFQQNLHIFGGLSSYPDIEYTMMLKTQ